MNQDYRQLTDDQIELVEKQTLRVLVQAVQEYSKEAREIFEGTPIGKSEIIVLAEDLVQYALEVAELYPINKRFAGFIDYKRVRWLPTSFGVFPQVLLVDAKASTENTRETLQQSQLPMDAEFLSNGAVVTLKAGVPSHMDVPSQHGDEALVAVTTSAFIHFYYKEIAGATAPPYRLLKAIYLLSIPHQRLKSKYNPDENTGFWGQGKHSVKRQEDPRIRVYFSQLRKACPWRIQELKYVSNQPYTQAIWRDGTSRADETNEMFQFIGR